jgi:mono/diheme cytochrome c family protein
MKKLTLIFNIFLLHLILSTSFYAQGEQTYKQTCSACHTIGGGKLVGPDLKNIHEKRKEDWLIKFIQSSQSMIKSGDPEAVALFNENNKVVMPDQPLNASDIKSILQYISTQSANSGSATQINPLDLFDPSKVNKTNIERGKNIFEGTTKLTNNGAPCISCHNIDNSKFMTGGLLSKDLTLVYSRVGVVGLDAILRNPPFPAMIEGFGSHPLTDEEVKDLIAFLYSADLNGFTEGSFFKKQFDLFFAVIFGVFLVLVTLLMFWPRVKKVSVNQK